MSEPNHNVQPLVFRAWLRSHGYSLFSSLGRFARSPLNHVMTLTVLALALALPTLGHLSLKNLRQLSSALAQPGDVSLFLKPDLDQSKAQELLQRVAALSGVAEVKIKTPDQALSEFRELTNFTNALDVLDRNPLPFILVASLDASTLKSDRAATLVNELKAIPEFDIVQFDQEWLLRLKALIALAERGVWVFAGLLALTVLLVIGNTIRLEISTRTDEISIVRLVGASDAFVRRPFLYSGLWFGLFASLLALVLVASTIHLLAPSVAQVAESYGSTLRLQGLNGLESVMLMGCGIALGWIGALVAVTAHLLGKEQAE
jgi:cell division transport system permease protein